MNRRRIRPRRHRYEEYISTQHTYSRRRKIERTYVPSGRLDSGTTRLRVLGSTVIPAVVVFGNKSGFDMMVCFQELSQGAGMWDLRDIRG